MEVHGLNVEILATRELESIRHRAVGHVLVNPLQNAGRYAREGGRVTVQAEPRGGRTWISVTNTGPAIPADQVTRIFDRFYRVDKSRDRASGGPGLGLALVKLLVEAGG